MDDGLIGAGRSLETLIAEGSVTHICSGDAGLLADEAAVLEALRAAVAAPIQWIEPFTFVFKVDGADLGGTLAGAPFDEWAALLAMRLRAELKLTSAPRALYLRALIKGRPVRGADVSGARAVAGTGVEDEARGGGVIARLDALAVALARMENGRGSAGGEGGLDARLARLEARLERIEAAAHAVSRHLVGRTDMRLRVDGAPDGAGDALRRLDRTERPETAQAAILDAAPDGGGGDAPSVPASSGIAALKERMALLAAQAGAAAVGTAVADGGPGAAAEPIAALLARLRLVPRAAG